MWTVVGLLGLGLGCDDRAPPSDALVTGTDADVSVSAGLIVVGEHPNQTPDPAQFRPLQDGAELDLVFGYQGLFMAVLGLRVHPSMAGRLEVALSLTVDDHPVAILALDKLRTVRAADGHDYLWQLQVIIDGDVWRGRTAVLDIVATNTRGEQATARHTVVIGEPIRPTVCFDPSPRPSNLGDLCADAPGPVARLDPGGPVDRLHVAAGLGKANVLVGALRGTRLLLWEQSSDTSPTVAYHDAPGLTSPWLDDSGGPDGAGLAGPWALAIDGVGGALVWGGGDDQTRLAVAGQAPVELAQGTPIAAFPAPGGFKVIIRNTTPEPGDPVWVHSFGADAAPLSTHFVVNTENAGGPLDVAVENDLIAITYPGLAADQPMMVQTASLGGGQCSIPASLGVSLGEGTARAAAGMSYGLPLLAVTRPSIGRNCPPSHRLLVKPLNGELRLDTESAIGWTHGVRIVANDDVAAAVGAANVPEGWQLVAQFADMKAGLPGVVGIGPDVDSDLPSHWDVLRVGGKYASAWANSGGVWLQRFCFRDPLGTSAP